MLSKLLIPFLVAGVLAAPVPTGEYPVNYVHKGANDKEIYYVGPPEGEDNHRKLSTVKEGGFNANNVQPTPSWQGYATGNRDVLLKKPTRGEIIQTANANGFYVGRPQEWEAPATTATNPKRKSSEE
ncbi:uncharacterized protein PgNI_09232 [Pyricularia grisea]|uniref:Uncharacterized protein n=1 Tax=Pyricularia grisea TaxID=148305 RepID=A0A6P8ATI3_PYRGI|nr:uncharacterized protein PgNI_09232 [Pyricularia grisea]TLD05441.1 hypothetical protein PgNI_09232 [Pyricularia grisea]